MGSGSSDDGRGADRNSLPNKRRRIPLACSACRTRKSRCDGDRPKCSTCLELGFDCTYVQSASSSNVIVGKEYLALLERRLKAVEDDLRERKEIEGDALSSRHEQSASKQKRLRFDDEENGANATTPGGIHVSCRDENVQDAPDQQEATDGIGAAVFSDREDSGFFGPSSNIAFTRHITRAVASVTHNAQLGTNGMKRNLRPESGAISVSRPSSPAGDRVEQRQSCSESNPVDIYALPRDVETRELLRRYFSNTGLLFPFIHEESFLQTYADVKKNNFSKVRRTWLGLLNIILALVTSATRHVNSNNDTLGASSDVFYQRAVGLCDRQIRRGTSLEVGMFPIDENRPTMVEGENSDNGRILLVQYLLVTCQYLQGTQKSIEAWQTHGLAVKAALQLGLHSSEASKRYAPLEREIRARTWFCCVIVDRTLSMTFGRPAAIPDDYVKLDLPVDYETMDVASPTRIRKSISVSFFNATITLYKIIWIVIDLNYGGNIGCSGSAGLLDFFTSVFQIEQKMMAWVQALPPSLTILKSQDVMMQERDPELERFRVILTLRYHNLNILIHRPVLVKCLDQLSQSDPQDPDLSTLLQVGGNNIQFCVNSSVEIITIVHGILKSPEAQRTRLGAWWFSLYYTFNAGLVIFASLLLFHKSSPMRLFLPTAIEESRKSLDDAVEALQLLDRDNRSTQKCSKYLARLGRLLESLASSEGDHISFAFNVAQNSAANFQQIFDETNDNLFAMPPDHTHSFNAPSSDLDSAEFMTNNDWAFLEGLFGNS